MFFQVSTIVNNYFRCFFRCNHRNNFFTTISDGCNSRCKRSSSTILRPGLSWIIQGLSFFLAMFLFNAKLGTNRHRFGHAFCARISWQSSCEKALKMNKKMKNILENFLKLDSGLVFACIYIFVTISHIHLIFLPHNELWRH